jgi:hypothetical protein
LPRLRTFRLRMWWKLRANCASLPVPPLA